MVFVLTIPSVCAKRTGDQGSRSHYDRNVCSLVSTLPGRLSLSFPCFPCRFPPRPFSPSPLPLSFHPFLSLPSLSFPSSLLKQEETNSCACVAPFVAGLFPDADMHAQDFEPTYNKLVPEARKITQVPTIALSNSCVRGAVFAVPSDTMRWAVEC